MDVEFIAHAGFCIRSQGFEVLIDPWFTSSQVAQPVLKSILPPHQSIDYLIPAPVKNVDEYRPNAILISHFHTHHSNRSDLEALLRANPSCIIACCKLPEKSEQILKDTVQEIARSAQVVPLNPFQSFRMGPLQVVSLPHCSSHHTGWLLQCGEKKFAHLADSPINRLWWDRRIDPVYLQLKGLSPDFLALTAAAQTWQQEKDGIKTINENCAMGPYEAARLAHHLGARSAAVMGMFNFSVWRNRFEYSLPSEIAESQFYWAMKHLNSDCQVFNLRPGCRFHLSNDSKQGLSLFY